MATRTCSTLRSTSGAFARSTADAEEVAAAADYVEAERDGYANVLLDEYSAKLEQLGRFPRSGARLGQRVAGFELRAFSLRRFPYALVVALDEQRCVVVAFAHTSREPGYWRDRVK